MASIEPWAESKSSKKAYKVVALDGYSFSMHPLLLQAHEACNSCKMFGQTQVVLSRARSRSHLPREFESSYAHLIHFQSDYSHAH